MNSNSKSELLPCDWFRIQLMSDDIHITLETFQRAHRFLQTRRNWCFSEMIL